MKKKEQEYGIWATKRDGHEPELIATYSLERWQYAMKHTLWLEDNGWTDVELIVVDLD